MTEPLHFPSFDPVIFSLFGVDVRWYGLMYLVGFFAVLAMANRQIAKPQSGWDNDQLGDLMFYGFIGAIIGGRIGYVLFYQWSYFIQEPLFLFKIWTGGMSFHGGLLGVAGAMWFFAHQSGKSFLAVTDFGTPLMPLALAAGRIGNFINGELWGKPSDVPWAMVFPLGGPLPRHPSQLYEFLLEGVVLFIIMLYFGAKQRPLGRVSGLFLITYGLFRFIVEYFREPDAHLGLIYSLISMGQILSLPMVLIGGWLLIRTSQPIEHSNTATLEDK
ncbi:MAG: phosphatidylglycerol:prolipoprotein diacylglycerol transferase [Alteromonadaceae bacterium]|jgi:phosphatidylglycerol:prolipoprotein diacylglycerol transferase